ncbi:MAG: SDR family NAD(P)-dependent oxidoreductase [Verrucomicrobiota bacterium]
MKYVITGGSSGLGFELAKRCHQLGDVICFNRNVGKLGQLKHHQHFCRHYPIDLSVDSLERRDCLMSAYKEELEGHQYKLILNAAQFAIQDFNRMTDDAKRIFEINYFSQIELLKCLCQDGLKRVIFINSISGREGQANQFQYSASKHALQGFVSSLFKSSNEYDFDVININPGGMKTELWDDQGVDHEKHKKFLEPSHVADLLMALIEFPGKVFVKSFEILPESDVR